MLYHYTSLAQDGKTIEGDIEGMSLDNAISLLQKKGITVVSIVEKNNEENDDIFGNIKLFKKKITTKDIVVFSRQVATLFQAGVSALKAFRLLAQENENETLQEQLIGVSDDIEGGVSLSEALSRRPELFSNFYVNMVKAGEESGKLNEVFLFLADYLDREYEMSQKIKKALTYPAFVIGTFFVIMIGMLTFVIPKMTALFAESEAKLPTVTVVVVFISNLFVKYWAVSFPTIAVLAFIFYKWSKTEDGATTLDDFSTKVPVLKTLQQRIFLQRFADNMNTMLSNGVPIVKALDITASIIENRVYKQVAQRVSQKVQVGKSLSKSLYEEPLVPNILVQMVHIGEETGELGYILKNLAEFYRRELETTIDTMIGLIEPAMIVSLGLGVGVLVSAVLLPMYSMSSQIG
ncbi:MAG: type II secretion system F family protein [Candidatus Pacebacteria bacterium]|nr:type II secretion system F family protein [Candidatus Paceibacterota bacterium]MBP9867069.1 type II secretion system F family protein [Candidatus Paceibacterota bacterium]